MSDIILGTGKVLKKKNGLYVDERAGKAFTPQQVRNFEKYTGTQAKRVKDSYKENKQWTTLMMDHHNR